MIFVYPGTLVFQDFLLHYVIIFLLVSRKCRHSSFHEGILHFFLFWRVSLAVFFIDLPPALWAHVWHKLSRSKIVKSTYHESQHHSHSANKPEEHFVNRNFAQNWQQLYGTSGNISVVRLSLVFCCFSRIFLTSVHSGPQFCIEREAWNCLFYRWSDVEFLTYSQKPRFFWIILPLNKHDVRPGVGWTGLGRKGRADHRTEKMLGARGASYTTLRYLQVVTS